MSTTQQRQDGIAMVARLLCDPRRQDRHLFRNADGDYWLDLDGERINDQGPVHVPCVRVPEVFGPDIPDDDAAYEWAAALVDELDEMIDG